MIQITQGDLLQARADALVNPVNCVGVMGKGLALQFKRAFPANFRAYAAACKARQVQPGRMHIHDRHHDDPHAALPRWIVNFPTKRHWRQPSQLQDVRDGLEALVADVRRLSVGSIAVPPLGCGLGGLDWQEVRPLIAQAFAALPDVRVLVYAPGDAHTPASTHTHAYTSTHARAGDDLFDSSTTH